MIVVGAVTRQRYHFHAHGDILVIDGRDASGMVAVPKLIRLRATTTTAGP